MNEKELESLHLETLATLSVMQAQIHALIAVSPHHHAIRHFYQTAMETHFARGLGRPVPEQFLQALERANQIALQEMPAAPESGA
jgi:hypothetical protein